VDPVPLFTRFQIETQIESAFAHAVTLPSGGSIVIDHTEAMVSIDINSARATKGGDIEATALNTNLEAAEEIARQLRIRDLGGLVVIDFIDMGPQKNQRDVENRLREAVRQDRARVQIGKISRFGLLEMSRQRLRPSIGESAHQTCPRCSGFGTIRSVESLALAILRIVGEEARKERTSKVIAQLPVEVATYLLNEKRDWVQSLESRNEMQVVLVANSTLETPHYEVRRVRDDQMELAENAGVSYELAHTSAEPETPQAILQRKAIEQPVVGTMKPTTTAPKPQQAPSKGLWATLVGIFSGDGEEEKPVQRRKKSTGGSRSRRPQQSRRRGGSDSRKAPEKRGPQRKKATKKTAKKTSKKTATKKTTSRKKPSKKAPAKKQTAKDDQRQPAGTQTQAGAADESRDDPKRSQRNRRSRGGRRRRRTADKPEQVADNRQPASDSSAQQQQAEKPAAQAKTDTPPQKTPSEKPAEKPAEKMPEQAKPAVAEAKPADRSTAPQKTKPQAGPPRARTDEERARDAAKSADKASHKKAAPEEPAQSAPQPKPDAKPAGDGNGAPGQQPARRLLPWEPQPAADVKPAPKTAAAKPAPNPAPAPKPEAAAPVPKKDAKPENKPVEPAQD
jgi:ribonuclease E